MIEGTEATIQLDEGRSLAYSTSGSPGRPVLLWFHGSVGGRLDGPAVSSLFADDIAFTVAFDRPGFGISSRRPGHSVNDVALDAIELLDRLGIDRCVVAGVSNGGPFAAATAAALRERARGLLLVSSVAPVADGGAGFEQFAMPEPYVAARRGLEECESLWTGFRPIAAALADDLTSLPGADGAFFAATPQFATLFAASARDSIASYPGGIADDGMAIVAPWNVDWTALSCRSIVLRGSNDHMLTAAAPAALARLIPRAEIVEIDGGGHLSLIAEVPPHFGELMRDRERPAP